MADIPWYSSDLAKRNADQAITLQDLALTGQHSSLGHYTQSASGGDVWAQNAPPGSHWDGEKWVDEHGRPVALEKKTQTAPAVLDMLGGAATTPNWQLDPNGNPYLKSAGPEALAMASGQAGQAFGLDQSRAAADAAAAAANDVGTAGGASARAQTGQLGQTGQDLGVVRTSALGMGPSAAEHLARSQLDSNIRAQSSLAATARGGNLAAAMRGAQNAGQNMMLQSQQQIAAQRAQEQLNAQGLLTQGNASYNNALYGARSQDVGQAVSAAQAAQGVSGLQNQIYNTNASMGQFGVGALNNSAALYGTQMGQKTQADQNSRQAYADWLQRQFSISSGIPVTVGGQQGQVAIANDQAAQQREAAMWNALGTGVASLGQWAH